jgi:hypothetical protein
MYWRGVMVLVLARRDGARERTQVVASTVSNFPCGRVPRHASVLARCFPRPKVIFLSHEPTSQVSAMSFSPARLLETWLSASGKVNSAVFRIINKTSAIGARLETQYVRLMVQPRSGADDNAHGLHAGSCTESAKRGATARSIARTARHRSVGQGR